VSGSIPIPMKVVNEMGEVVETSSHPINGKHGGDDHGKAELSARGSPVKWFFLQSPY
jgi:hypothetical protein